jgi:hypothetical protein
LFNVLPTIDRASIRRRLLGTKICQGVENCRAFLILGWKWVANINPLKPQIVVNYNINSVYTSQKIISPS